MRRLLALASLSLCACSGGSTASGPSAAAGLGAEQVFSTHVEVELVVESRGTRLAGRLLLPPAGDAVPLVALVRGSDPWLRLGYEPFTANFIDRRIAVISWDKRARGSFELYAADAIAALRGAAAHPRIDGGHLGLYGFSEGGWVVPLAAAGASDVAFTLIASGPAVSTGEDEAYDRLTGIASCASTGLTPEEVDAEMARVSPSGFEPAPYLSALRRPALWQFCANDQNIPVRQSILALERIRTERGNDFTVQVFPNCNHNFVRGGALCQDEGPRVDWVSPMFRWLTPVLGR